MPRYYVNRNAQANGDHEVHTPGCRYFPTAGNVTDLGEHLWCHTAVTAARAYYAQVNGCYYCSNACHTG